MISRRQNRYGQVFENYQEPFEFFTFYPKKVDTNFGILSLQALYDKQEFETFDKIANKYTSKLFSDTSIFSLTEEKTKEEILESMNDILGECGSRMIYFFRYIPFKLMGNKIRNLLSLMDVYKIDLNEKKDIGINDIWWGHYLSDMKNKELDEEYYKTVIMKDYFKMYRDGVWNNLSTIPHIGIATDNGVLSSNWFKKVRT